MKNLILIFIFISIVNLSAQYIEQKTIDINRITFPIQNNGDIGSGNGGILFDSTSIGYSMGFYLSGYMNDSLWSNGMFHSSSVLDYLPGNVGEDENSTQNKIFMLSSKESAFDSTWIIWKTAVDQGAYYYDGDNDGVYNPIDLNGNGMWDENEDKPDLLGNITAWSVYNDSKPKLERTFKDTTPKGIEVAQTIFAYSLPNDNLLNNVIFVRYVIKNKGTIADNFDSVYFSLSLDPDIGNYWDDLTGSDINLNSAFAFNNNDDELFGVNPPAIYTTLLQGPLVKSEVLDSKGIIRRGPNLGIAELNNSANLKMTSSVSPRRYAALVPIRFPDPANSFEARNYIEGGKYLNGNAISVSNFELGNGNILGSSADTIDAKFMFSGDPVNNTGWLSTYESDWRTMNSTGPFELSVETPIEIIYAYIVGQGNTPLSSLSVTKQFAEEVIEFYNSNFTQIPTSIDNKDIIKNYNYDLYQNYPNPFNPSTEISFQIPVASKVSLKLYDILGHEVATLLNQEMNAGKHNYQFSIVNYQLSSGVYFYRLTSGSYSKSMKMLLLK